MRIGRPTTAALMTLSTVMLAGLAFTGAQALALSVREPLPVSPFGSFSRATGVAVDQANGNVFVADSAANVIRVFSAEGGSPADGSPSLLTGEHTPAGSFNFNNEPVGVAVDAATGSIYVTDVENSVVDEFRVNGASEYEYVCQFTGYGFTGSACLKNEPSVEASPTETRFGEPIGVTVDHEGNFYIADYRQSDIYEFNRAGDEVRRIPGPAEPQDVAVDAIGDLYVRKWAPPGAGSNVVELKRGSLTGEVQGESNTYKNATGIAFDVASKRLFLGFGSSLAEYDEAGETKGGFGGEVLSASAGIAVNEAAKSVYVANGAANEIDAFGPRGAYASATTGVASKIGAVRATVTGTVDPESETLEATCEVQYGKTLAYEQAVPCTAANVGNGEVAVPETASLTGLEGGTEYHYRVVAVNSTGANVGSDATFTTEPAFEGVVTGEASSVTDVSATFNGTFGGVAGEYYFEYGEGSPEEPYTSRVPVAVGTPVNEPAGEEVDALTPVNALKPGTEYHYRLVVVGTTGTEYGQPVSVSTLPEPPVVLSESAEYLEPREAFVSAMVNPNDGDTTYHFIYGPSTSYGLIAPVSETDLGSGLRAREADVSLTGLTPGTTYHYALVAHNGGGITVGPDETFTTTRGVLPVVVSEPAVEVSQNSATLTGTINPQRLSTGYEFDIGTDTTYGARVFGAAGSGSEPFAVSLSAGDLAPGTTYHYRLVATNTYGTTYGADLTFTTPGFPTALISPPLVAALVPTPVFAPPSDTGTVTRKTTKPARKKKAKHETRRRRGKASRATRYTVSGRSGR